MWHQWTSYEPSESEFSDRSIRRFESIANVGLATAILLAVMVIAGWLFGIPQLTSLHFDLQPASLGSAVTAAAISLSFLLQRPQLSLKLNRIGCAVAVGVTAIAAWRCIECYLGVTHLLDPYFIRPKGLADKGGMPTGSVALFVLGLAGTLLRGKSAHLKRLGRAFGMGALLIPSFVLVDYAYHMIGLLPGEVTLPMSLMGAVMQLFAAIGANFILPRETFLNVFAHKSIISRFCGRMAEIVLVAPIALGYLAVTFEKAGWADRQMLLVVLLIVTSCFLLGGVVWSARSMLESERKRILAKRSLVKGERFLRAVLNGLDAQVAIVAVDGKTAAVNDAWRSWVELDISAAPPDFAAAFDGVAEELRLELLARVKSVALGESDRFATEFEKDGRWFSCRISRAEMGKDAYAVVANEEITARKLAEQALAEREHVLSAIIETSLDALVSVDELGRIVAWNQKAEEFFGWSKAEALGVDMATLIVPESQQEAHREGFQRFLEHGSFDQMNRRMELTAKRRNGSTFPVEISLKPIKVGDQRFFPAFLRDISERKRDEEARALLATLVESSSAAIISTNLDGTIMSWNRAAEQILDFSAEEIIGRSVADIMPAGRKDFALNIVSQAAQGLEVPGYEARRIKRSGEEIWVSVTASLIRGANGEVKGVSAIVNDITELKRGQEASEARMVAERANRAKSAFLSRISHELRTPLNAILGFGQLLQLQARQPHEEEAAGQIMEAGRHLLELIDDVLEISRVDAGTIQLHPEDLDVEHVIEEAFRMVSPLAERGQVQLVSTASRGHTIHADHKRLLQILLNLLTNGIKYNRPEGFVSVEMCHEDQRILLFVRDTGMGIPSDQVSRLFQPFDRLGAEGTAVEGTGLGLSLSKGLAEAMGGALSLAYSGAGGSCFCLELPVHLPAVELLSA